MLARQEARRGRRARKESGGKGTYYRLRISARWCPAALLQNGPRETRLVTVPAASHAPPAPRGQPRDAATGPAAHVAAPLGRPGGRRAPREVDQAPPAPRRFPGSTLDRERASPRPPAAPAAPPLPARDLQAGARPRRRRCPAVPPGKEVGRGGGAAAWPEGGGTPRPGRRRFLVPAGRRPSGPAHERPRPGRPPSVP